MKNTTSIYWWKLAIGGAVLLSLIALKTRITDHIPSFVSNTFYLHIKLSFKIPWLTAKRCAKAWLRKILIRSTVRTFFSSLFNFLIVKDSLSKRFISNSEYCCQIRYSWYLLYIMIYTDLENGIRRFFKVVNRTLSCGAENLFT